LPPPGSNPVCTLSLHDALPILLQAVNGAFERRRPRIIAGTQDHLHQYGSEAGGLRAPNCVRNRIVVVVRGASLGTEASCFAARRDRKSTRLNSSHLGISYAVFC